MLNRIVISLFAGFALCVTAGGLVQGRESEQQDASARRSDAPGSARAVVVPANVQWTNTGIAVSRGQALRFESTGEIRLSFDSDDVARPAGTINHRFLEKAPIPSAPAGALIGRVGNGPAFAIGTATKAFDMPASGRLYLGVNDDHAPDNSGNFVVKIWQP